MIHQNGATPIVCGRSMHREKKEISEFGSESKESVDICSFTGFDFKFQGTLYIY